MKLQQETLDQTGIGILIENGKERAIPLYSLNPVEEAQYIVKNSINKIEIIKAVYFSNNLMETKIEDIIKEYRESNRALPEDYMEELLSGFPYVNREETLYKKVYYA